MIVPAPPRPLGSITRRTLPFSRPLPTKRPNMAAAWLLAVAAAVRSASCAQCQHGVARADCRCCRRARGRGGDRAFSERAEGAAEGRRTLRVPNKVHGRGRGEQRQGHASRLRGRPNPAGASHSPPTLSPFPMQPRAPKTNDFSPFPRGGPVPRPILVHRHAQQRVSSCKMDRGFSLGGPF